MQRPTRISRRDNIDATCRKPHAPVKTSAMKGQIALAIRLALNAICNEGGAPPEHRNPRQGLLLVRVWPVAAEWTGATIGGKHGRVAQPQVELQSDLHGTVTGRRHPGAPVSHAFASRRPVSAARQQGKGIMSDSHNVAPGLISRLYGVGNPNALAMQMRQYLTPRRVPALRAVSHATPSCLFAGMAIRGR